MGECRGSLAIEIENLTLQFGEQTVLERFSLSIQPGQKIYLSGNSGTGKSSLLRSLLGFIEPRQGQIRIGGNLLNGKSVWPLRRQMAYVAQEPQLGSGKVRQLLQRPFAWKTNHCLTYNADHVADLCRRLHLPEMLLDKDIAELSGGEKQRIALISAILLQRSIYLLDEATSAVDAESKKAILDYWAARTDLTIVIVSHDTAVSSIADRVVVLPNSAAGRVI